MNRGSALLVPLLLLSVPCGAGAGNTAIRIDAPSSEAGFQLRTRWGRWVSGRLPVLDGQLVPLPQGEYQVWLELDALGAEISDQPRYTRMTRGEDFFDADRHPRVRFESMPFSEELAHQGASFRAG